MRIYFLAATQHDNLGDLIINKMLIDELTRYGTVYVDAAGIPQKFKNYLLDNINTKDFTLEYGGSLKRLSALKALSIVKHNFDYFFVSPGPWGGTPIKLIAIIRRLIILFEFRYLSKGNLKLNLVGNDIAIKSRLDIIIEKYTNRLIQNCFVRSNENSLELKKLGFKNLDLIPDLAFLYDNNALDIKKDSIYISFRDLHDKAYRMRIISICKKYIPYFLKLQMKICFFYQVQSDKEFNADLYKIFKTKNVSFRENCLWYSDIETYGKAKFVITNRLHVMLLGMIQDAIPLIILNKDSRTSKINKILSDCDLNNLLIEDHTKIEEIEENYLQYKSKVNTLSEKNKLLCQNQISKIFNR